MDRAPDDSVSIHEGTPHGAAHRHNTMKEFEECEKCDVTVATTAMAIANRLRQVIGTYYCGGLMANIGVVRVTLCNEATATKMHCDYESQGIKTDTIAVYVGLPD